jgi:hypothetical protein
MGPIVGGSHGWPFAAAGPGRLPEGYVEEEYFIEGDAVQYALAPGGEYAHDGRWDVVEREPSRFRTRFIVRRPVDPARFGGTVVVNLLAAGESQSACRLATYYNALQSVTQRFDGFVLIVYAGCGTRLEAAGPGPALEAIPDELRSVINILPFGSHLLRPDLAAPVLVLNSETEVLWYLPVRQPDTSNHRLWEITGTAHLDGGFGEGLEAEWQRDFGEVISMPLIEAVAGPPNTLSYDPAANAALRHVWSWMKDGAPPPEQARVELAAKSASGGQHELARDEFGNALGGIRLPDFAVPTGTHVGASVGPEPDLAGTSVPFTSERLRAHYPDHATYVERYNRAVDEGLAKGFLVEEDAGRLRAKAAAAPIP